MVTKQKLKTIKEALHANLIDAEEAGLLLDRLEFEDRKKDILKWGKYYFPDKFPLEFCYELHNYLIDTAEDLLTNTLAPRGHAKTTIRCFLILIYFAYNHPDKFRHYLNIQATSTKAIAINLTIRNEIENNERLRNDYGDMVGSIKWTEKQFVLANDIIFTCIGSGDSVRGINYNNIRPDYVIGDDLYDENEIESPDQVNKKNSWFWGSIYKAVAVGKKTCIHIQGTAVNKNDLMHELQNSDRWKFKKFKAVLDWDKELVLWPAINTIQSLEADKKDMGSIRFMREMQNEIRDDENAIIKERDIQYFDGTIPGDQRVVNIIGAMDPAAGTKDVNDATGKVAIYLTDLHNYYIMEAKNDRITLNDNVNDVINWHQRLKFTEFRLEAISGFKGIAQEIRRKTSVPLREINQVKDKITRKVNISPKFENKKVFINQNIPDDIRNELVAQLINNKPPHDDLADAVVLGLEDHNRDLFIGIV